MRRRAFLQRAALGFVAASCPPLLSPLSARAQGRADTLVIVTEMGPNMLDVQGLGGNRATYGTTWASYDRLMTFGTKRLPSGALSYDYFNLQPELAESWQAASDGMSVTFKLRRDARFHDGTPVTARDVKWSFDRMIGVGGFPQRQMEQGSLVDPKQFVVVDDHTIRVDFVRRDKLTMPSLAIAVPTVYNAELAKKQATAADPWAMEFLKKQEAGSGAYVVESWLSGQQTVFVRNENWKQGPLPAIRRVVIQVVPSAGNRRAMLERGDADVSLELPPRDFQDLANSGKFTVASMPMFNTVKHLTLLTTKPPFDHVKVRQAAAYAIPYQKIIDTAVYGRARALHGASASAPTTTEWPQPFPYTTDPTRAKALLTEAGYANGFETTLTYDANLATVDDPTALLIQEALAQIGIRVTVQKFPDFPARRGKKDLPMTIDLFGAWFDDPDFYYRWIYHGQNTVWNLASYKSEEMDKLLDAARYERDRRRYGALTLDYIRLAMRDVPFVPLYQPFLDVAMQKNVTGYVYMFHRQVDFRKLAKA